MDTVTATRTAEPAPTTPTTVELRPRYEGSNICTWIGFKHVNYLVEEAVLDHLRRNGLAPGRMYEQYALCTDIADIDTRILHAYHIDDLAVIDVRRDPKAPGELAFIVELGIDRAPGVRAASSRVRVDLRHDPGTGDSEPVPEALAGYAVAQLGRPVPDPIGPVPLAAGRTPEQTLTEGRNAYAWTWRVPYPYCHFTKRVQMSGYLRLMEEAVDLFLADRGVSIRTLLDEQSWIPVVPHSRITLVGEALMEERICTVFTVEDVFKRFTYTARMDSYAVRGDTLVPVATGRITHGYAVIDNRRDWHLVSFDDRLTAALEGR